MNDAQLHLDTQRLHQQIQVNVEKRTQMEQK